MAQTKRKRRSKHRGNAAGTVVQRGRTGRKLTEEERKAQAKAQAREKRGVRFDKPPTWKGSFGRAGIATAIFFVLSVALFRQKPLTALAFCVVVVFVYAGFGYATDLFMYRRRQKRKAAGAAVR